MKRTLSRLATLAVALPLTVGVLAGSAQANHGATLPGCWGGVTNATIVCNLTVTVGVPAGVETYQTTIPVCTGTCQQVPVTLARPTAGEPARVCYSYTNGAGVASGACFDAATIDPLVDTVVDTALEAVRLVAEIVNREIDETWTTACRTLAKLDIYCA